MAFSMRRVGGHPVPTVGFTVNIRGILGQLWAEDSAINCLILMQCGLE